MKTKILALAISAAMILGCGTAAFAEQEVTKLTIENAQFNTGATAELEVTGKTPAKFGQLISVVAYEISSDSDISALAQSDNPSQIDAPSPDRIVRVTETVADTDGSFRVVIPFEDEGDCVLIVKVSGGGSVALASPEVYSASALVSYIEDMNVVYDKFWNADSTALESLMQEYQLPLNLNLGENYEESKALLASLFVSVRTDDTAEKFSSSEAVRSTFNSAKAIAELGNAPSADELKTFVRTYSDAVESAIKDYNGTENEPAKEGYSLSGEDYTLTGGEEYSVLAGIFKETPATSMTSMAKLITQSAGIVLMNQKDGTTISPVVKKYGAVLGISTDDYTAATDAYDEYEVNKAFVEKGFSTPAEVVSAFKERLAELAADSSTGSNDKDGYQNSSSGLGGGGGSSGTKKSESAYGSSYTEPDTAEPLNKNLFNDLSEEHWAAEAVTALAEKEVINGFSDGSFRPDEYVTREQLIKMLLAAMGAELEDGAPDFSDVEKDRWSASYIFTALGKQLVNGVGNGKFAPEAPVTRQDAAVMIARCCDAYAISISDELGEATDADAVSDYARTSVGRLINAGIINGFEDGSFRPTESLTRAQAAKLIYGLIK